MHRGLLNTSSYHLSLGGKGGGGGGHPLDATITAYFVPKQRKYLRKRYKILGQEAWGGGGGGYFKFTLQKKR